MAAPSTVRRKFWGWGLEGEGLTPDRARASSARRSPTVSVSTASASRSRRGRGARAADPARRRLRARSRASFSADPYERAAHTLRQVVSRPRAGVPARLRARARSRRVSARRGGRDRRSSTGAARHGAAAIPFGGGSSVAGGVEPDVGDGYRGAVSDRPAPARPACSRSTRASRAARIAGRNARAGARGAAEAARPHAAPLPAVVRVVDARRLDRDPLGRPFRDALHPHRRVRRGRCASVTPRGVLETRRLPGSGAGPSPERLFCGSEGTLGVITEAWMRLQARPDVPRRRLGVLRRLRGGGGGRRASSPSPGSYPSNCRLLDHDEALLSGSGDGSQLDPRARLRVGRPRARAVARPRARDLRRATAGEPPSRGARHDAAGGLARRLPARARTSATRWPSSASCTRRSRPRSPGIASGSSTTACSPRSRRRDGARRAAAAPSPAASPTSTRTAPRPTTRSTRPAGPGQELEQWDAIKAAASEAILALGGTITHHHSVGRDHRPWYLREVPDLFAARARRREGASSTRPGS